MTGEAPPLESILTGNVGHVGPRRAVARRAADRLLDLALAAMRAPARLDRLASAVPLRRVLALCVYRPEAERVPAAVRELRTTRHELRLVVGPRGEPREELPADVTVPGLDGGKFENNNVLLRAAGDGDYDWLLVVDDDVVLPVGFVDRALGLCERLGLGMAQPAQTLASHAAWPITRRRPLALARETDFVEIGPVTIIRREIASELTPFPELRMGWGLDLHWAALARERGWRRGILDALPVRHDEISVAAKYPFDEAVDEAQRFLAERPFVPVAELGHTLALHRRLP
jgi:hypothetical protein